MYINMFSLFLHWVHMIILVLTMNLSYMCKILPSACSSWWARRPSFAHSGKESTTIYGVVFAVLRGCVLQDLYTDWQTRWPLIWYYLPRACFGSELFFIAPANWWYLDGKLHNRRSVILPIMSPSVRHSKAKMQVIDKWIRLVRLKGNDMTASWILSKKKYSKIKFRSNYCF